VWLRKRAGAWQGFTGVDVFSDDFNPNDVGQLDENNFVAVLNSIEHDILGGRPFGPFQRADLESFIVQQFSYLDGTNLGTNIELSAQGTTLGFQQIGLEAQIQNPFGGNDPYETRGLGLWAPPAQAQAAVEFETDERRSWQVEPEVVLGRHGNGGMSFGVGFRGNWNVGSRLALETMLEGEWENDVEAWSSNEAFRRDEAGWSIGAASRHPDDLGTDDFVPITDGSALDAVLAGIEPIGENLYFVPVFGERDTRALDLTVRSTITFTPVLSLQLYGQLFLARARFQHFQILRNRDDLADFGSFPKRNDFSFGNLQSNFVLRWEYRRGSSLFLVWTHSRRTDEELNALGPWGRSPYDRPFRAHLGDTFGVFPDNAFIIKLNYTFLY
jgi:hypothetical protein